MDLDENGSVPYSNMCRICCCILNQQQSRSRNVHSALIKTSGLAGRLMFRDTLWDTPELKQAALTWHCERGRQRGREREGPWKRGKKGLTESTWVGSVRRSGVQLLTPLHTQLQKNRTARSGLNWCTHVHLHWRDNWTDRPLKCLLKWPEPQRGNLTPSLLLSFFTICPSLSESGPSQTTFSTHLQLLDRFRQS